MDPLAALGTVSRDANVCSDGERHSGRWRGRRHPPSGLEASRLASPARQLPSSPQQTHVSRGGAFPPEVEWHTGASRGISPATDQHHGLPGLVASGVSPLAAAPHVKEGPGPRHKDRLARLASLPVQAGGLQQGSAFRNELAGPVVATPGDETPGSPSEMPRGAAARARRERVLESRLRRQHSGIEAGVSPFYPGPDRQWEHEGTPEVHRKPRRTVSALGEFQGAASRIRGQKAKGGAGALGTYMVPEIEVDSGLWLVDGKGPESKAGATFPDAKAAPSASTAAAAAYSDAVLLSSVPPSSGSCSIASEGADSSRVSAVSEGSDATLTPREASTGSSFAAGSNTFTTGSSSAFADSSSFPPGSNSTVTGSDSTMPGSNSTIPGSNSTITGSNPSTTGGSSGTTNGSGTSSVSGTVSGSSNSSTYSSTIGSITPTAGQSPRQGGAGERQRRIQERRAERKTLGTPGVSPEAKRAGRSKGSRQQGRTRLGPQHDEDPVGLAGIAAREASKRKGAGRYSRDEGESQDRRSDSKLETAAAGFDHGPGHWTQGEQDTGPGAQGEEDGNLGDARGGSRRQGKWGWAVEWTVEGQASVRGDAVRQWLELAWRSAGVETGVFVDGSGAEDRDTAFSGGEAGKSDAGNSGRNTHSDSVSMSTGDRDSNGSSVGGRPTAAHPSAFISRYLAAAALRPWSSPNAETDPATVATTSSTSVTGANGSEILPASSSQEFGSTKSGPKSVRFADGSSQSLAALATPSLPHPIPHGAQSSTEHTLGAPVSVEAAVQCTEMESPGLALGSAAGAPTAAQERENEGEWVATPWDASVRPNLASGPVSLPAKKFASLRRRRHSRELLAHLGYAVVARPRQGQFMSYRKSLSTQSRVSSIEEGVPLEGPPSEPVSGGAHQGHTGGSGARAAAVEAVLGTLEAHHWYGRESDAATSTSTSVGNEHFPRESSAGGIALTPEPVSGGAVSQVSAFSAPGALITTPLTSTGSGRASEPGSAVAPQGHTWEQAPGRSTPPPEWLPGAHQQHTGEEEQGTGPSPPLEIAALGTLLPGLLAGELVQGVGLTGGPGLGYVGLDRLCMEQRAGGTLGAPPEVLSREEELQVLWGGEEGHLQETVGVPEPVPLAEEVRALGEAEARHVGPGHGDAAGTPTGLPGDPLGVPLEGGLSLEGFVGELWESVRVGALGLLLGAEALGHTRSTQESDPSSEATAQDSAGAPEVRAGNAVASATQASEAGPGTRGESLGVASGRRRKAGGEATGDVEGRVSHSRQLVLCFWSVLLAAALLGGSLLVGAIASPLGRLWSKRFGLHVALVCVAMCFAILVVSCCLWAMWWLAERLEAGTNALRRELAAARSCEESLKRAKKEFLGSLSHEIRTPLNGIIGMLQFLMEEGSLTEEEQEAVDVALMSCWSLVDWVATFVYSEMGVATGASLKVPKAPASSAPQADHRSGAPEADSKRTVGAAQDPGSSQAVPQASQRSSVTTIAEKPQQPHQPKQQKQQQQPQGQEAQHHCPQKLHHQHHQKMHHHHHQKQQQQALGAPQAPPTEPQSSSQRLHALHLPGSSPHLHTPGPGHPGAHHGAGAVGGSVRLFAVGKRARDRGTVLVGVPRAAMSGRLAGGSTRRISLDRERLPAVEGVPHRPSSGVPGAHPSSSTRLYGGSVRRLVAERPTPQVLDGAPQGHPPGSDTPHRPSSGVPGAPRFSSTRLYGGSVRRLITEAPPPEVLDGAPQGHPSGSGTPHKPLSGAPRAPLSGRLTGNRARRHWPDGTSQALRPVGALQARPGAGAHKEKGAAEAPFDSLRLATTPSKIPATGIQASAQEAPQQGPILVLLSSSPASVPGAPLSLSTAAVLLSSTPNPAPGAPVSLSSAPASAPGAPVSLSPVPVSQSAPSAKAGASHQGTPPSTASVEEAGVGKPPVHQSPSLALSAAEAPGAGNPTVRRCTALSLPSTEGAGAGGPLVHQSTAPSLSTEGGRAGWPLGQEPHIGSSTVASGSRQKEQERPGPPACDARDTLAGTNGSGHGSDGHSKSGTTSNTACVLGPGASGAPSSHPAAFPPSGKASVTPSGKAATKARGSPAASEVPLGPPCPSAASTGVPGDLPRPGASTDVPEVSPRSEGASGVSPHSEGVPGVSPRPEGVPGVSPRSEGVAPVSPCSETPSPRTEDALALLRGRKVLVVDDNAVNRKVLLARLKPYGVDCTQAVDGKDALNKMDPFPDHTFVCVFMDLQMPVMDGYEATQEIRKRESQALGSLPGVTDHELQVTRRAGGRRVPILAVTADLVAGARDRCLAAGMDGFMTKPLSKEMLRDALLQVAQGL